MYNFLFRVDADNEIGAGHLARCLALNDIILSRGAKSSFLFGESPQETRKNHNDLGIDAHIVSYADQLKPEQFYRKHISTHPTAIVFDTAHHRTLKNLSTFKNELIASRKVVDLVVIFDGFGEYSLRQNGVRFIKSDIVIAPYAGEVLSADDPFTGLLGPSYFVNNPGFRGYLGARKISDRVKRILITCGGSDVSNVTVKTLEALNLIDQDGLLIRVVIGPYYTESMIADIENATGQNRHKINFVRGKTCLAEDMQWCDLCISMSGLTKYELAATGTPAILLSIDRAHSEVHKDFDKLATALHLGIAETVDMRKLRDEIVRLMSSFEARSTMSKNGQIQIGGQGAQRIIEFLESIEHAEK